jgi:hypothetical protein
MLRSVHVLEWSVIGTTRTLASVLAASWLIEQRAARARCMSGTNIRSASWHAAANVDVSRGDLRLVA